MKFEDLHGWFRGCDCVVVGCGPSATSDALIPGDWTGRDCPVPPRLLYQKLWSIGCNRSVSFCEPDLACCVEPKRDPMWVREMKSVAPLVIITHIDSPKNHTRCVKIISKDVLDWWVKPEDRIGKDSRKHPLRLGQCPFYATASAAHFGFETIGLIGVDLTPDRYPHPEREIAMWGRLAKEIGKIGSRVVNLSPESKVTSIPQAPWSELRTKCQHDSSIRST